MKKTPEEWLASLTDDEAKADVLKTLIVQQEETERAKATDRTYIDGRTTRWVAVTIAAAFVLFCGVVAGSCAVTDWKTIQLERIHAEHPEAPPAPVPKAPPAPDHLP